MLAERAKQAAVALGIAVILPMLVYYGVASFAPPPEYHRYVTMEPKPRAPGEAAESEAEVAARIEAMEAERKAFEAAEADFARTLFLIAAPIGIVAIVAGGLVAVPALGPGLLLGGIANLVVGYGHYWQHLEHWMRFVSLLVAFAVLLGVAWRRFRRPAATRQEKGSQP